MVWTKDRRLVAMEAVGVLGGFSLIGAFDTTFYNTVDPKDDLL